MLIFITLSDVMAVLNNTAMECTGDVTFRRVRATHVVGDMKKVLHILSVLYSLRYSASKWHAPYCHLCPVPLYHIFPHFLINGTIFGKTVTEHKLWFDLLYEFCVQYFLF